MTWIQHLYDTYEYVNAHEPAGGDPPLLPICHTTQNAHIEIMLDADGNVLNAVALPPRSVTLIPSTEESAGRTSGARAHPLCDKLVYVAEDFAAFVRPEASGIAKNPEEPHRRYVELLDAWAESRDSHPTVRAIREYVRKGRVMRDLVERGVLRTGPDGRLLERYEGNQSDRPPIFAALGKVAQYEALVRWCIDVPGEQLSKTWEDPTLFASWIAYYRGIQTKSGFDMVTGRDDVMLAAQHPARLRNGADKAKLISKPSADRSGFTYRGRFLDTDEAASVSFEVTQKAHNALRWLIERKQAYCDGNQIFVIWSPQGRTVPGALADSDALFDEQEPADTAEIFAQRLARRIAGYHAELGSSDRVVVLGLDSATPGRMAITLYREVSGSDFLERIERWHRQLAWFQDYGLQNGRDHRVIRAPAPPEIAKSAYGANGNEQLRRAAVERLLACIIDGKPPPRDLVASTIRRACNPASFDAPRDSRRRDREDREDWEGCLSVACALFRGAHPEKEYQMSLEVERNSRDYLYGRLLAVANNIERYALDLAQETRGTTVDRLFHRFANRPASTWRTIELSLQPYKARLRANDQGRRFLARREQQIDEILNVFPSPEMFNDDSPLSGEFLLAFGVQRQALFGRGNIEAN